MRIVRTFVCLTLCLLFGNIQASNVITYESGSEPINIGRLSQAFVDSTSSLSAAEVWGNGKFEPIPLDAPNFDISNNAVWLSFTVTSDANDLCLQIAYPTLDQLILYKIGADGVPVEMERLGESLDFDQRRYDTPAFIFDLFAESGQETSYLLRVDSKDQILLPLVIGAKEEVLGAQWNGHILFGLYFGIILVMFFYNLFIYLSTKDKSYFWYVIHTALVGVTQSSFQGYSFQFLWPNSSWWANQSTLVLTCGVSIVGIFFFKEFVKSKEYIPRLDKVFTGVIGAYVLLAAFSMFGDFATAYKVLQPLQGMVALSILGAAIYIAKKGYRPAQFYLLAWSLLMVGIIIFVLKDFGVLPYNTFTSYTMQAGSALEVILLSIALADKINTFKREKEESQQKTLEALRENERIIKEQNVMLESKVKERTVALEETNSDLNVAMNDLKQAQSQLVDAEKMASLGQMTAGIAHELNNPINFVSSNLSPLKRDIQDLFEVLDKYDELKDGENIRVKLDEIEALKDDLELDFIRGEIDQLLSGINEGATRTAEIVKGLRVFSRLDEDALKPANMNECLESTLVIIESNLKGACKVIKDLDPTMPEIHCYPGKVNQVFMNVLNNAVQATQSSELDAQDRLVTLKTWHNESSVCISIKDNGIGISDEVKPKIFDPFFTTKDVGEGTGLGLSIVLGIINDHKAKIEVESKLGEGTEFIITLPKDL
jgi:two-component system, NtrC family, sensor kinase